MGISGMVEMLLKKIGENQIGYGDAPAFFFPAFLLLFSIILERENKGAARGDKCGDGEYGAVYGEIPG